MAKAEAIRWHDVKYVQKLSDKYLLKSYQAPFKSACGNQKVWIKPLICSRKYPQIYYRGCHGTHPDLAKVQVAQENLQKIKKMFFTNKGILGIGENS